LSQNISLTTTKGKEGTSARKILLWGEGKRGRDKREEKSPLCSMGEKSLAHHKIILIEKNRQRIGDRE